MPGILQESGSTGTPHPALCQTDSPMLLSSFLPFKLKDEDWETHYLERKLVLRLTNKIGQPISTFDNPTSFGSTGLFICLGRSPSSGSQPEQPYLLTCRHVVCPDGVTDDIGHPSQAQAQATINVMQPGAVEFRGVMDELERAISQKQKYINEKRLIYNNNGDNMAGCPQPSARYTKTQLELSGLKEFHRYCQAQGSPNARQVGPVAFSPALGIRNLHRRDWALVGASYEGANSSCTFDLSSKDKDMLLERVRPGFLTTFEGHTDDEVAAADFIKLDGTYDLETIEQGGYTFPRLSNGAVKAAAEGSDDEEAAEDRRFLVYKYGATTGSTCGALNCISSRHINKLHGTCTNYCIVGSGRVFSAKGDSGSAIFGLLPTAAPGPPGGSSPNVVLRRQGEGEDGGGPQHVAAAVGHGCTPAVVGIVWGGLDSPWSVPHDDVTYAIPIKHVLDDIEEYTCRPVVGLKRY